MADAQVAEVEVPLNEMCVRTLRGLCQIKQHLSPNNAESDGVDDDTSAGTILHNISGKSESGAGQVKDRGEEKDHRMSMR